MSCPNRKRCHRQGDIQSWLFSKPSMTVISLNVEGLSAAKDDLIANIDKRLLRGHNDQFFMNHKITVFFFFLFLFAIFILHSRESELYPYTLDGKSALAWELPFSRFYGPPVFHIKLGHPVKCLAQGHNKRACRLVLHNLP